VRIGVALAVLIAVLAGAFVLLWLCRGWLFTKNPRLTIRDVAVQSSGFFSDKAALLARRTGVAIGDNLFETSPRQIRENAMTIPCVENCEVMRVLPDTLQIRVIERIPRVALFNPRSPWVADEKLVVFPRLESMCAVRDMQLPVIMGLAERMPTPGRQLNELAGAMTLVMLTATSYPDLELVALNVGQKDKLVFYARYRHGRARKVIFPTRTRNYSFLLSALQSAIISAEQRGNAAVTFDLSFDGGNVYLRP